MIVKFLPCSDMRASKALGLSRALSERLKGAHTGQDVHIAPVRLLIGGTAMGRSPTATGSQVHDAGLG